MQCACVISSSVAFPAVFSHYHKRHDFRKIIEYKMFILIFSTTLYDTFFIGGRIERDVIKMYWSSCKVPVIFVTF